LPCEADWQKAQEIHSQYDYDQNEHNISGQMDRTTPVHMYVKKEEPLADFIGNVWEWQADPYDPTLLAMNIRGGAYDSHRVDAEMRSHRKPECREADVGFRIVIEFAY
jgi:formylglycine-generating enzyme required for sulfatase activity